MASSPSDKSISLCEAMAELLREKRMEAGLSLTDVAAASGLTRQMVGFVEKGTRDPSLHTVAKLAVALKTSPSLLLRKAERRCSFK